MTLPQNVKDAARSIDDSETVAATPHPDYNALVKIISVDDWQIISAHLLSQAAELAGYKAEMERLNVSWAARSHDVVIAESRLAAAKAEIEQLQAGLAKHVNRVCELQDRLAAANAQLRLMHRVLSQAVCVACADDGVAKDHELDKLDGVLRDQGWITTAVVPSTPTDDNLQGAGDEA